MFICTFYHTPVAICDRGIVFLYYEGGVADATPPFSSLQYPHFSPEMSSSILISEKSAEQITVCASAVASRSVLLTSVIITGTAASVGS